MALIDSKKCPCRSCPLVKCYAGCDKYDEWLQGKDMKKPLTVEELRRMNGEPVWIRKTGTRQSFWMLAYKDICSNRLGWLDYRDYGEEWVAYRYAQEEGVK